MMKTQKFVKQAHDYRIILETIQNSPEYQRALKNDFPEAREILSKFQKLFDALTVAYGLPV